MSLSGRALTTVMGVLVYLAVFVYAFVGAQVDPEPHDLPVVVAADGERGQALAGRMEQRAGGALEVETEASPETARATVKDGEAYGALVLGGGAADGGGGKATVYIAGANGQTANQVTLQALTRAAREATGQRPAVRDVAPLVAGDPRALAVGFLILPLVIVGIISASILRQRAPELKPTAQLGSLVVFSVAGALIAMLLAQPLLDALPGPFLAEAALLALAIFAIAATTTGLFDLIGPAAVGLAFVIFLIIGNIGAGGTTPQPFLPAFWRTLGPFLPPGAAAESLRQVAYFGGANLLRPILVSISWVAAGVALTMVAAGRARRDDARRESNAAQRA